VAETCGRAEFEPPASNGPLYRDVARVRDASVSDCVQGAVLWYGLVDASTLGSDPDTAALLGCTMPCSAQQLSAANPLAFASAKSAPMLVVQGTADPLFPPAARDATWARFKELGVRTETMLIPDVAHGFIGKSPDITKAANDKALQRTFEYLDTLFRSK
jgi:dienelactone hydrolase